MSDPLAPRKLKNGLIINFEDQSNRYFGDYHRVFIRVKVVFPDDFELPADVCRNAASFERTLEKMAVPTAQLDREKLALVESFLVSAQAYLEGEDFPCRLVANCRGKKNKPPSFLFEKN